MGTCSTLERVLARLAARQQAMTERRDAETAIELNARLCVLLGALFDMVGARHHAPIVMAAGPWLCGEIASIVAHEALASCRAHVTSVVDEAAAVDAGSFYMWGVGVRGLAVGARMAASDRTRALAGITVPPAPSDAELAEALREMVTLLSGESGAVDAAGVARLIVGVGDAGAPEALCAAAHGALDGIIDVQLDGPPGTLMFELMSAAMWLDERTQDAEDAEAVAVAAEAWAAAGGEVAS